MIAFSFLNPGAKPAPGSQYAPVVTGGATVPVVFSSVSGTMVQSPSGIWGTGTGFGVSSAQTLPLSTNGLYQADYLASNNRSAAIGWDSVNTLNTYSGNWSVGVFVQSGGNYYYIQSGSATNTGVAAAVGDKYGLRRTGGATPVYTAEYYRSGSWTVLFTYAAFAGVNAVLYFKGELLTTATYLSNPILI